MDLIEPAIMEDDDVKHKASPETVTVLETEGQPLRDDEQKLHMRSILVLVVSAVAVLARACYADMHHFFRQLGF
jgi:hypothetical protein